MELYYLMSITDRDRAEDMAALYRDAGLNLVTTMLGRGTATPQQLALYGLSRTEKAVTGAVVGTDSMKQLCRDARVPEEKGNPRCLRRLWQETQDAIRVSVDQLVVQAFDQMMEAEQFSVGWDAGKGVGMM